MSFSNDMDDEYEKLFRRLNPPRVVIDNEACKNATVIRVDSANKHVILLEVVQVLTDLNLIITKAYISSDGGWFMDGKFLSFVPLKFSSEQHSCFELSCFLPDQFSMSRIKMEIRLLMSPF
uniref:ACT domain-containing protein ACR n=1 Tax=Rhizophora mucronata TaxID=61149 RepID=A0A2P2LBW0_RHIMU